MKTLTGKLLSILIPLLLILATVFLFAFNSLREHQLETQHSLKMADIAESYASALHYPLWSFDAEIVSSTVKTLSSAQDISCVFVKDLVLGKEWTSQNSSCIEETHNRIQTPILHKQEKIAYLDIYYNFNSIQATLKSELYQGFLLVGGLLLVLLVGALTAQRFFVGRPLNSLLSTIRSSKESHRYTQVNWKASDEFGLIVNAFNGLIKQQQANEEKIVRQAHYDHLTDLPNRFLSMDRLTHQIEEAKRLDNLVAVLFIDIDDFKKVNDSLGHETGDKLLIDAAERLCNVVRSGDTVGRLGGDEFVVILGGIDNALDARAIAENLLLQFRQAFKIDGRELILTCSIGIAIYPEDSDSASSLLRNADSAMYHSKSLGRNTYSFFTDEMNKNVSRRLEIEEQIHGALERREFEILYQPKYDIHKNTIYGAEALLRWHNPALGTVSPAEFIPIAEQSGLIVALGDYVLQEALEAASKWHKNINPNFQIAANLSPRQFRNPALVMNIERLIRKYQIPSRCIELEITEGVLMSGHTYIDEALDNINDLGITIAMDDFGTGYSSLSYLRTYPFDVLKIDKSFINDVDNDPADRELINAAISMAHSLHLKVVAEGVETQTQLDFLIRMDCDYAQGYLFSKPVSAEEMGEILLADTKKSAKSESIMA